MQDDDEDGQQCSWGFAFDKDHYGAELHLDSWLLSLQKNMEKVTFVSTFKSN